MQFTKVEGQVRSSVQQYAPPRNIQMDNPNPNGAGRHATLRQV
jgi:hypothetical protein